MKQTDLFQYTVAQGEVVTVTVTPVKVGPFVTAATEGAPLPNLGGATPRFTFPVNKPTGGTQIANFVCNFPGDTDDEAEYEFELEGSSGGQFTGPVVEKQDPMHKINLIFDV
jgi:hypothetical protein